MTFASRLAAVTFAALMCWTVSASAQQVQPAPLPPPQQQYQQPAPAPPPQRQQGPDTFEPGELVSAGHKFFGNVSRGLASIIERAVSNGLTEVQVCRFPNNLCTDRGRAINQQEPGWETTLTGFPNEIYQLWAKYFRERGYKLRVEILDFPGGMPGDVGMTLKWG